MSGSGRIPLVIQASAERDGPPTSRDAGNGALLRLAPETGGQSLSSSWLVSRDVPGAIALRSRHGASCLCCLGQNPLIAALHQLFLDRVRGSCPLYSFVVISCAVDRKTHVRQMLEQDVLVRARYEF